MLASLGWRAYPRSRGATPLTSTGLITVWGLSPLTRGNRPEKCGEHRECGPIPAHAGQPSMVRPCAMPIRAYPRSRGATSVHAGDDLCSEGLSPLTRGNRLLGRGPGAQDGPIPAHAGQPRWLVSTGCWAGAYPRSRGATDPAVQDGRPESGLSPLTRGNPAAAAADAGQDGPIPAHAGQPFGRGLPAWRQGAYPRSRGAT